MSIKLFNNKLNNNALHISFRNAIRVLNISGEQVGHIPRGVAAKLSPLLDTRRVTVDGVMTRGNCRSIVLIEALS